MKRAACEEENHRYLVIMDARRKYPHDIEIVDQIKKPDMWDGSPMWVNRYKLSTRQMHEVALLLGRHWSKHRSWITLWQDAYWVKHRGEDGPYG